jgi:hypothetical protein
LCFCTLPATIADAVPLLMSAPVTSITVMLQPVRLVPQPLAVTTPADGLAVVPTHKPTVSTPDWNTLSSSE